MVHRFYLATKGRVLYWNADKYEGYEKIQANFVHDGEKLPRSWTVWFVWGGTRVYCTGVQIDKKTVYRH